MSKNKEIEELKSFIISKINDEQREYADLIYRIKLFIGGTAESENSIRVIEAVYNSRRQLLEEILKKVQTI